MRIGIDSGGTFTDCVFIRDGKLQIIKVASRLDAPQEAIAEAVKLAISSSPKNKELDLVCGTTVGTNSLLERRGGRVVLLTTEGFEDVLEIGRQARPKLYDLFVQRPDPLVPSSRRLGVRERLAADGAIIQHITSNAVERVIRAVKKENPDSVALCFLFSFRNARHEKKIGAKLRAASHAVSISHEILNEFREYERISTTVVNAYLVPVMSGYLRDTTVRIGELFSRQSKPGFQTKNSYALKSARVRVMQSNGGITSAEQAAREPVRTILSGPAGGVIGAAHAAKLAGIEQCISFDMGGTSTDVALLTGELRITSEAIVANLPVAVPMLEIHTVGAGGGSIARFDAGGALRAGPESAGAEPGPICYGRGTKPTVTDAHALLGHLGSGGLLGGTFSLDIKRARAFLQSEIKTSRAGFSTVEAFALGIIAVANSVMEKAIRVISVERGHDPRDYTLVAFGGAGALHACDLAAALEIPRVLVPCFPGALSALGILRADVTKDLSHTIRLEVRSASQMRGRLRRDFSILEREGRAQMRTEGFAPGSVRVDRTLDIRYAGQSYELGVPFTGDYVAAFHRAHEQLYGYSDRTRS